MKAEKPTHAYATEGGRIRAARDLLGLTSAEMAAALKISRGYLSELENDKSIASDKVLRSMELELAIRPAFIRASEAPPLDVKKLTSRGKQDSLSGGGDAFGQGQKVTETAQPVDLSPRAGVAHTSAERAELQQNVVRYVAAKIDPGLLSGVLAAVLEELRARGLELPTEKLAELVALVYEDLSESQADDASRPDQAQRTAKRYLRLVA